MTLKPLLGILETIIQNHFKSHMLGLKLIGIVSFLKLLEIRMHSLHLLYPLLNVLRIASLDSHHWWDLENSPLIRWPWWMYVSWCVTGKLFWFWFRSIQPKIDIQLRPRGYRSFRPWQFRPSDGRIIGRFTFRSISQSFCPQMVNKYFLKKKIFRFYEWQWLFIRYRQ